jgi:outer membrane protein TolC
MKKLFLLICLFAAYHTNAQTPDSISLSYCISQTVANYPLIKQQDIYPLITNLRIKNLDKNFLPQMSVNGSASYQSDVTKIPISLPGLNIPDVNKDNYKISLDVNQVVYDGGITKTQKNIENAGLQIDKQNVAVSLYNLKQSVIQLYFNILLLQENEKQLNVVANDLAGKLKIIESGVRNGVQLQSNADLIKIEILKTKQQLNDVESSKAANISMLGLFMNVQLNPKALFTAPENLTDPTNESNVREELKLFDYQLNKLDQMKKLSSDKNLPRISLFGQAGYGRPGLNMLNPDFADFYIVGARLSWNFWNWNQTKNEIKILDYQKDLINNQKEIFDKSLKISLEKELADIQKYNDQFNEDAEIIKLRENVVKAYSSQLDNGVITATDYITQLTNKSQAVLQFESHKLMKSRAIVNYLYLLGKY